MKNDKPIRGHDLLAVERYFDATRHMIVFDVLDWESPVGGMGERLRMFLSEKGYMRAREAEKRGHIKIRLRAAVVEGHILIDVKKRRGRRKSSTRELIT